MPKGQNLPCCFFGMRTELLRLSGRALGTYPLGQPDRIRIRDASIAPAGDQRCGLASQGAVDGLQALGHGEPTMEARQLTLARRAGVA